MSTHDPISDLITRIRNAQMRAKAKERFDWEGGTVNEEEQPSALTVAAPRLEPPRSTFHATACVAGSTAYSM